MNRTSHAIGSTILALLLSGHSANAQQTKPADPARPNILLIMSDDHALRTIGAYGDIKPTPNLDRIAAEGAVFINSFCTNSICCPSRAAILTGKHSHKNGMTTNNTDWDGSQTVFPRLLSEAGYHSALVGKWHLPTWPTTEFDHWEVLSTAGGQGDYYNPEFRTESGTRTIEGYSTDVITDLAIEWMESDRDPEKPFLLMTHYKAPHVPRVPAPRFLHLYEDEEIEEPTTLHDDYSNRAPYASTAWMMINDLPEDITNILPPKDQLDLEENKYQWMKRMTPAQKDAWHAAYDARNEEYRELKAAGKLEGDALTRYFYQRFIKDYLRIVKGIDENVGRLLDYLDESGLAENTIVIYTSDQGYYTGEHSWAEKRWMYEESLKMPFLIRWPGVLEPGQRIEAMIQNIDYAPTLLEAAGVEVPEEMDGRSIVPLLRGGPPADWRDSIYYHYYEHGAHNVPRHYGVRTDRYKLIHYYTDDVWELFDLEEDPRELMNVYDLPSYSGVVSTMKAELVALRDKYEVPEDNYEAP